MITTLHQTALASGATLAPAYECDGTLQPATYTMTLAQLQAVAATYSAQMLSQASKRLQAVPLKGRIGDWHEAQLQAHALAESAELLLYFQQNSTPA